MKSKKISLLINILLMLLGYSCSDSKEETFQEQFPCCPKTFKQTYLKNFQKNDVFFIKGVVQNFVEYGCTVKIIEDLKSNFDGKSPIFIWGAGPVRNVCDNVGRLDYLDSYQKNDTLFVFFEKITSKNKRIKKELIGDYTTLKHARSTLQLSYGYVTGNINTWAEASEKETMLWKELHLELQTFLFSDKKPSWWYNKEDILPNPFIIMYKQLPNINPISNRNFFIQGMVLESYNQHGKMVQIINDFKGNFSKETTTFITYGDFTPDFESLKYDDLKMYNSNDTLLMLLMQDGNNYATFNYGFSVLKLSNNSVIGYITSCYKGEEAMTWEDFQTLLKLSK